MPELRTERVVTESNPHHFGLGDNGRTNTPESHQSDHRDNQTGHAAGNFPTEINGFVERHEKQGLPGRSLRHHNLSETLPHSGVAQDSQTREADSRICRSRGRP